MNKYLWEHYYKTEDLEVNIPDLSLYAYMHELTKKYQNKPVLNYFGRKITYQVMEEYIEKCAKSLKYFGIKTGDVVTICMPNTPEAVITFFAVNKIGAVANMVHPLSAEEEIKDYLVNTKSIFLIALNSCYSKIKNIIEETKVKKVVIASPSDSMPIFLNTMYNATLGRKEEKPKYDNLYIFWKEFLSYSAYFEEETYYEGHKDDTAVILHSGGTTGIPKSIVLANRSIIGVNEQAKVFFDMVTVGESILNVLPIFHCFGLVVGLFIPICKGAVTVLIPQFDAKKFDKLLVKYKPNYLIGVPTLFEAMLKNKNINKLDLSYLKCLISGGDSLTPQKNAEINEFLSSHNSRGKIIQGYGMTETTGPVTFGTKGSDKLGSIGIPLPGNVVKIIDPETKKEVAPNEIGEICVHSFVVMEGYLNNKKATEEVLIKHDDGLKYIHTGDLGYMDEDGVIFYVQRMKRIIISSGYNIYPQHIENVLKDSGLIKEVCVIGVPHPYKKEIAKAFIVLNNDVEESYTTKKMIMDYAKKNLAHYMLPREYIYRSELPKTKLNKIDYRALEDEFKKQN